MSDARVALTFDAEHWDAPSTPDTQDRILDALEAADVRAAFFIQGRWARAYPAVARRIADAGHLVGSHSHHHAPMSLLTDDGIVRDLEQAQQAIADAAGVDPRPWFRCPYGDGHDDPRVLAALGRAGYRNQHWHLDPHDFRRDSTAQGVRRRVVDGARGHGDGAVVLLHTWPPATAEALPGILGELAAGGPRAVRLDEVAA